MHPRQVSYSTVTEVVCPGSAVLLLALPIATLTASRASLWEAMLQLQSSGSVLQQH